MRQQCFILSTKTLQLFWAERILILVVPLLFDSLEIRALKFCGLRSETPTVNLRTDPCEPTRFEVPESWAETVLTAEERAVVADMRAAVADVEGGPKDWITMIKFARSTKCKVKKAAEIYRNAVVWRESCGFHRGFRENSLDTSLHRRLDAYITPLALMGFDKKRQPLLWGRYGVLQPEIYNAIPLGFLLRHASYENVRVNHAMEELLRTRQEPCYLATLVVDLEGVGRHHLNAEFLKRIHQQVRIGEENYPEGIRRILITRAPWIFSTIWNLVKNFLNESTREKIEVRTCNYP